MVETVILDQMSPHCDPEFEDRKPVFLHILAHDVVSPYQVWLQKVQQQWRYSDEHSLEFLTFVFCELDLDHNRAIQPFHKTIHLIMMYH